MPRDTTASFDPKTLSVSERRLFELRMSCVSIEETAEILGRSRQGVVNGISRLRKKGAVFPPLRRRRAAWGSR